MMVRPNSVHSEGSLELADVLATIRYVDVESKAKHAIYDLHRVSGQECAGRRRADSVVFKGEFELIVARGSPRREL